MFGLRFYILAATFGCATWMQASPPSSDLYPIIWKWLGGKSDSVYHFNANTHLGIVRNISNAYQVRRAREFWYEKNLTTFQLGSSQWLPVNDFLGRFQTIRGVCRAGFDMVEQTLGGFIVHITPVGKDSIEFKVHDIKSRWSLFFHLPFINNIPYDPSKEVQKNMSDCHWFITWREPIKNRLFYQRQFNKLQYKRRSYTGHNF